MFYIGPLKQCRCLLLVQDLDSVYLPPPPPAVYHIMTIVHAAMIHHWRQLICTCIYNAADILAVATSSSFSGRSLSSGTAADDVWIRHFLALARSFQTNTRTLSEPQADVC